MNTDMVQREVLQNPGSSKIDKDQSFSSYFAPLQARHAPAFLCF